jgi:hypothetical protein
MIRKTFYLTAEQVTYLEYYTDITVSEHIRRAIDEYIEKKKRENYKSTVSPSNFIKGVKHV